MCTHTYTHSDGRQGDLQLCARVTIAFPPIGTTTCRVPTVCLPSRVGVHLLCTHTPIANDVDAVRKLCTKCTNAHTTPHITGHFSPVSFKVRVAAAGAKPCHGRAIAQFNRINVMRNATTLRVYEIGFSPKDKLPAKRHRNVNTKNTNGQRGFACCVLRFI